MGRKAVLVFSTYLTPLAGLCLALMTRENSFSDEDGHSLTPDLEDDRADVPPPRSPTYTAYPPHSPPVTQSPLYGRTSVSSTRKQVPTGTRPGRPSFAADALPTPRDKFRSVVRKVIAMHRSTRVLSGRTTAGAEPGIDPRRESVALQYDSIKTEAAIQVIDYSGITLESRRMGNKEFIELMDRPARKGSVDGVLHSDEREHWVKVRWINIAGVSWDVIKAISIKYGT